MQNLNEKWIAVKNYENIYCVSNLGGIKSLARYTSHGHSRKERILKLGLCPNGYYEIGLRKENKQIAFLVHRLVAEAFIPNSTNKPQINHKNGIKTDNRVENLEWVTAKENAEHRDNILGKHTRGIKSGRAKLTEAQIVAIRQSNLSQRNLSKIYNTARSHIQRIKAKTRWAHI